MKRNKVVNVEVAPNANLYPQQGGEASTGSNKLTYIVDRAMYGKQ